MNIRPEDIVEGNGKLTLGLIWTIIIGTTNEKLDHILTRIEVVETRVETSGYTIEVETIARDILSDLNALKPPIDDLFADVDILKQNRHPEASDYNRQLVSEATFMNECLRI